MLVLDELTGPDPEDDLEQGQEYPGLASVLVCTGESIAEFCIHDCVLRFRCARGSTLVLHNREDGTLLPVERFTAHITIIGKQTPLIRELTGEMR
ncbi:MAG: hypothetical protein JST22_04755 [Bacteroidetes bacterium]|nr:hypothetical protein [Bacteroidota bacterium]